MALTFRLRESYDWVAMGESPGILLSAALAARMGFSTLIVPLNNRASVFRSSSGQVVDPESCFVSGVKLKLDQQTRLPENASGENYQGLLGRCLYHLELNTQESTQLEALPFSTWIQTPKGRIAIGGNQTFLKSEIHREWGKRQEFEKLVDAFGTLETKQRNFWESFIDDLAWKDEEFARKKQPKILNRKLSLESLQTSLLNTILPDARKSPISHVDLKELLQAIGSSSHFGFRLDQNPKIFEQLAYFASESIRSKGGLENFRQLLIEIAKRWGAHVLNQNSCRRIFVDSGRFVGFQASQVASMISAKFGAVDTPIQKLNSILEWSGKSKPVDKFQTEKAGWVFTLSFTMLKSHLPNSLGHRWVFSEYGAPVIEFEVADPVEYGLNETNHRLLFARNLVDWDKKNLDPNFLRNLSALIYEKLLDWVPDLDQGLVRMYPDFRNGLDDLVKLYSFQDLNDIPESLIQYQGVGHGSQTGIPNLYLVSKESFPSLGQQGEWAAAIEAMTALAQNNGYVGYLGKVAPKAVSPTDLETSIQR